MMRQLKTLRALMADFPDAAQRRLRTTLPQLSPERKQQIKQLLTEARRKEQS